MFCAPHGFDSRFLRFIRLHCEASDFACLREGFDAYADVNLSLAEVLSPLNTLRLPRVGPGLHALWPLFTSIAGSQAAFLADEAGAFHWSIKEAAGPRVLSGCPVWVKVYVVCLYVYCERVVEGRAEDAGDYLYLLVQQVLDRPDPLVVKVLCRFLEWLCAHCPKRHRDDDYYQLLCWLLLKPVIAAQRSPPYEAVVSELIARRHTARDVAWMTAGDRGPAAWDALLDRVPAIGPDMRYRIRSIILGLPT